MPAVPASLTAECLAELSSRGPRYTSYPPATEFAPLAGPRVVRELATVQCEGAPISLSMLRKPPDGIACGWLLTEGVLESSKRPKAPGIS